jgi:hypothetical protein
MSITSYDDVSWDRMSSAIDRVRERLRRASRVLGDAGVAYAVVGGNAVAAWVSRVDEAAVRNTQDVDILLRRGDLTAATTAMHRAGFVYRHVANIDVFLDGPDSKVRDAVHVVFAGERVRSDYPLPAPGVEDAEGTAEFRLLSLEPLVRMKLTSYRDKDRVHLRDLIGVGLVDGGWVTRMPAPLADRLQAVLDDPDG